MNIMNYVKVLSVITLFSGLGVAAQAQAQEEIAVTVPFQFVAGGRTLPAGMYKVKGVSLSKSETLLLTSSDSRISVFLLPFENESAKADMPQLSFQQIGQQRVLSVIQTAHNVYDIRVSPSIVMEAAGRSHDSVSAPASGGYTIR